MSKVSQEEDPRYGYLLQISSLATAGLCFKDVVLFLSQTPHHLLPLLVLQMAGTLLIPPRVENTSFTFQRRHI